MILRPYQSQAARDIEASLGAGKRPLLVLPTGGGKTVIAGELARDHVTLVLAHRQELVTQAARRIPGATVMSIQAAARRDAIPGVQRIIVDEAHHAAAASYRKVLDLYPGAQVIGLTATPWRTDRRGLGDLFTAVVVAATPAQLIAEGSLCPYEAFAYQAPDVGQVALTHGDFILAQLALAANTAQLRGHVVAEYLAHGKGCRALVYAVNVEHSQAIVRDFQRAGVRAAHLDWSTPKRARAQILEDLHQGDISVVSNVAILTEGFDCPAVEMVILARPTHSLTLHLQMVGRALRPSPGKQRALIHDHAGNMVRHGFPDDEREYGLTKTSSYTWQHHTCPFCSVMFARLKDGNCPACGVGLAEQVEETLQERRRKIIAEQAERMDAERIREERAKWAENATLDKKRAAYEKWRLAGQAAGHSPKWAAVKFLKVFGHWPRFGRAEKVA